MISSFWSFFLSLGIIFGTLSGILAFLITHNEYVRHYKTKKEPIKISLEMAVIAFCCFFLLSLIVGYFLSKT